MTAHLLHNVPKERHLLALLTGPTWMQRTGQAAYLQEIGEALWPKARDLAKEIGQSCRLLDRQRLLDIWTGFCPELCGCLLL